MDKGLCIEFKTTNGSDFHYFENTKQANKHLWNNYGVRIIEWKDDLKPFTAA